METGSDLTISNIEVFNPEGRKIYTGREQQIDLRRQPHGTYLVEVTTGEGIAVEKVVLE
ncbi:MAG: T9SS type A sorting domain-containing protein [Bacteroidetes bacterium]|nr:T9SS type A sorting domain-containing protein [Bacteroidota bacterium]